MVFLGCSLVGGVSQVTRHLGQSSSANVSFNKAVETAPWVECMVIGVLTNINAVNILTIPKQVF